MTTHRTSGKVVGVVLSWDGARLPRRAFPATVGKFLAGSEPVPPKSFTALVEDDQIDELRICWVPQLRGGDGTLSAPFAAPEEGRVAFRETKRVLMGEILGVVYRRNTPARKRVNS